jgi:hypothetical protein
MTRTSAIPDDYLREHASDSLSEIAAHFHLTPSAVRLRLKKLNLYVDHRLSPIVVTRQLLIDRRTEPLDAIAADLSCSREYIGKLYVRYGISRQRVCEYRMDNAHAKRNHNRRWRAVDCPCQFEAECRARDALGINLMCESEYSPGE